MAHSDTVVVTSGSPRPQLINTLAMLLALCALSTEGADKDLFPRPVSLQPAIDFWTRVYTEVDSRAGYVHDNRNLNIVYEKLQFKWYSSREDQERAIEQAIQRYQRALRGLAESNTENLTDDEKKVLVLWGGDTTPDVLQTAEGNVRFQRGQADRVRDGIVRAGAWEDYIRQTLRDAGLPDALAALPHVESSYHPRVRSPIGAAGLWQFTLFTGKHYLQIDQVLDERYDPLKSTQAAARLLERYYSVLKSWPLAITAYNHGMSGVRRAVRETGSTDIGDIVRNYRGPRFGFASRNFYAAFVAAMDVTGRSRQYFGELERHPPEGDRIVKVPAFVPVASLSQHLDVDAALLKKLNPSLQHAVWNGSKYVPKGYDLRLPADAAIEDASTLVEQIAIAEGRLTQLPDRYYKVQRGDTLSDIAQRYKVSVRDLMAMNNVSNKNRIHAGQSLLLPGASAAALFLGEPSVSGS
jgi:membrane-bound lytic murein transglycosylase D